MQAPGTHVCPCFVVLFIVKFPCTEAKFVTLYAYELSCAAYYFWPLWKSVGGLQGSWSLVLLIPPYIPCWLISITPVSQLYSVVLTLGARTRTLVPERHCPTSIWPLSPVMVGNWLALPTVLGWLHCCVAISVWDIHISPLSSRFHILQLA